MRMTTRTCLFLAALLGCLFCLNGYCSAQIRIIDPGKWHETFNGVAVKVCPVGSAMKAYDVANDFFVCLQVAAPEMIQEKGVHIHTRLDVESATMHVCPSGWYMRGFEATKNWLVCSDGIELEDSFLDAAGKTQIQVPVNGKGKEVGIHGCPVERELTIMVGIDKDKNDFTCAPFQPAVRFQPVARFKLIPVN
jgi:hypothetical protein